MTTPPHDLTSIIYRVEIVERDVKQLQVQIQAVPLNDMRLQTIQETVHRIEQEVAKAKDQLNDLNVKLVTAEQTALARDNQQRAAQDKLQIRVLLGILGLVGSVITGFLVLYFAHLLH